MSAEFYKVSRKDISECLINSYNYAYFSGRLSVSQKSGIIKLIPKNDSEAFHVKNWRPIDLIGYLSVVPNSDLPGLRFFVCCICMRMWHLHLNDMEIPETKRFCPKGFELGTTLS